jgi:outer membrane lipoprotein-sorting protein
MRTLAMTLVAAGALFAADNPEPTQAQIDEIVQKFAAHEAEFAKARESYVYKQTARIQELDDAGNTTGRWETVSDIIFASDGKRSEHVTRSPVSTLSKLILTPEDMEDLKSVQPFVLTTDQLPKYYIRYLGRQKVDEIGCYVFAVKPIKYEGKQRYFQGEVWVDDKDLQIVKSYGRGVGSANKGGNGQQFPKFETYREQVDGKFWFPTYTIANDTLHFKDMDVRMKQTVKYEDYKRFKADTSITFGDAVEDKKPPVKKP